ncbi:MAG: hypothetical protein OXU73_01940 [Candidatus Campbellbacteria bacterium]|nr:hypothetical protein [Candidatus Campbellbacteria bacterium]
MDIQDLNNSQLILLSILVSFIIAVATTITVFTLLYEDNDNENVEKRTVVNRIVERTIEQVVPADEIESPSVGDVVTAAETSKDAPHIHVVSSVIDLLGIIDSIRVATVNIINSDEKDNENAKVVARGLVINEKGRLIVSTAGLNVNREYVAVFEKKDGTQEKINLSADVITKNSLSFKPILFKEEEFVVSPISLSSSEEDLSVGSFVFGLGVLDEAETVSEGIIRKVDGSSILTSIDLSILPIGAPILNYNRVLIGIVAQSRGGPYISTVSAFVEEEKPTVKVEEENKEEI